MPELNEKTARALLSDFLQDDTLIHPHTDHGNGFIEMSWPFTAEQLAAIDWWLTFKQAV